MDGPASRRKAQVLHLGREELRCIKLTQLRVRTSTARPQSTTGEKIAPHGPGGIQSVCKNPGLDAVPSAGSENTKRGRRVGDACDDN